MLYVERLLLVLDEYYFKRYEIIAQYAVGSCAKLLPHVIRLKQGMTFSLKWSFFSFRLVVLINKHKL